MTWLVVDKIGTEYIYSDKPKRFEDIWESSYEEYGDPLESSVLLPNGTIKKLIGRELTWEDEPVELKEEV